MYETILGKSVTKANHTTRPALNRCKSNTLWPEQSGWVLLTSSCTMWVAYGLKTESISHPCSLSATGPLRGTPSQPSQYAQSALKVFLGDTSSRAPNLLAETGPSCWTFSSILMNSAVKQYAPTPAPPPGCYWWGTAILSVKMPEDFHGLRPSTWKWEPFINGLDNGTGESWVLGFQLALKTIVRGCPGPWKSGASLKLPW